MTELIGREAELGTLKQHLADAMAGKGSTVLISGEPGIGKTMLVQAFKENSEAQNVKVLSGAASGDSAQPFLVFSKALAEMIDAPLFEEQEHTQFLKIFAINHAGMLVAQASSEETEMDADIFAGMLSAVQDFVRDSFGHDGGKAGLGRLEYGDMKILIEHGRQLFLTAVISGSEHPDMKGRLQQTLLDIEEEHGGLIETWTGKMSEISSVQDEVTELAGARFLVRRDLEGVKLKNERIRIADRVLEHLVQLSDERTLAMILEDLHWADESSLFVLQYIARNIGKSKVLVLCSARTSEGPEAQKAIGAMKEEGNLVHVELEGLEKSRVVHLIDSLFPSNDFSEALAERLSKDCTGNPFFITEVLHQMSTDGAIVMNNGRFTLSHSDFAMPGSVDEIVKRRLECLDPDSMAMVEYASCIGMEIPSWALLSISNVTAPCESLEHLRVSGIIRGDGDALEFSHALFQASVYDSITARWRVAHHRSIGRSYEERFEGQLEEVAYELARHCFLGKVHDKAFDYCIKAGEKANSAFAAEQAFLFYSDALEAARAMGPTFRVTQRIDVVERAGIIQTLLGRYESAIDILRGGFELARDSDDRAKLHRRIAVALEKTGELDKALAELESAMCALEGHESLEYARVLSAIGMVHEGQGDYSKALEEQTEALSLMKKLGAPEKDVGLAQLRIGASLYGLSRYDDALEHYSASLANAQSRKDLFNTSAVMGDLAIVHAIKGDSAKAQQLMKESLAIKEKIGDMRSAGITCNNLGVLCCDMRDFEEAEKMYRRYLDISRRTGDRWDEAMAQSNIATLLGDRGQIDGAISLLEKAIGTFEKIGDKYNLAFAHLELGDCWLNKHDTGIAEEHATISMAIAIELGSLEMQGIIKRSQGRICAAREEWEEAARLFESSIGILKEIGNTRSLPGSFWFYGKMLAKIGNKERAREMLCKAKGLHEQMGHEQSVKEIDEELERL